MNISPDDASRIRCSEVSAFSGFELGPVGEPPPSSRLDVHFAPRVGTLTAISYAD